MENVLPVKNLFLGIDPGLSGAWAIIDTYEQIKYAGLFTGITILTEITYDKIACACIEQVHAMPGQGVTSMFTFGTNYGMWLGALEALHIPYILCTPQRWQKTILDTIPSKEVPNVHATPKEDSARRARNQKLLKEHIVQFVHRYFAGSAARFIQHKKDWGIADALCMALYAKRMLTTPETTPRS